MSYGSIYKITNTINSKVYVGQTKQNPPTKRWYGHKWDSLRGRTNTAIGNALRLHGSEKFNFEIICSCLDRNELNKAEEEYIVTLNSLAPNGYNIMKGGDNYERSKETLEKMSNSLKGRIVSDEWRKNISEGHRGLKKSEETKQRIRNSHMGKHMSDETKEKLRSAHIGKKASLETIKKMSDLRKGVPWSENRRNATAGRKHSEETKQKIRSAMIGHNVSEETRVKIRDAKLNRT